MPFYSESSPPGFQMSNRKWRSEIGPPLQLGKYYINIFQVKNKSPKQKSREGKQNNPPSFLKLWIRRYHLKKKNYPQEGNISWRKVFHVLEDILSL